MKDFIKKLKTAYSSFSSTFLAKILILAALLIIITAIIFAGKRSYNKLELREGDISLHDIYAPHDFMYPTGIDNAKTEKLKEKALSDFLPVYDMLPGYWEEKREVLLCFFKELNNTGKLKDITPHARIEKLKKSTGIKTDNELLFPFLKNDGTPIEETAINVLNRLSSKIIAERIGPNNEGEIILRNEKLGIEGKISCSDIYTSEQLRPIIEKELKDGRGIKQGKLRDAYAGLLLSILEPSMVYNKAETETRRKAIIENIAPVYSQILIKKNESIIGKGQKVTGAHLLQLDQLSKRQGRHLKIAYSGGIVLLIGILILILGIYLNTFRKKIFIKAKNLYLISIITILTVFLAKIITSLPLSSYLIPVAAASMLLTILLNAGISFMLSILLSILAAIIAGNKFDIMLASLIGGIAGIYFTGGVRQRNQILKAGLLVGISKFAVICGIGLVNGLNPLVFLKEGCWGIGSGIMAAGIVMVLLPVFEFLFKITTDLTLLELSDLNHPLLKKMVMNAPGTYHHSIIVGNLAEAASDSIGANSLMARVGAYYHDIGKIEKPEYY
ncbi:MAG: HDIG domain-containing protein, partial [Candidatus Omnitrophota bacterium]|nr:HDIG domain-containing protein [Candidatus Omnitrophota bacterium]